MDAFLRLLMLTFSCSTFLALGVSLLRIWFLFEETRWGSIPESIWLRHQIWFELLWIICGTLGITLLFVFPVWIYTQQYSRIEKGSRRMPFPVLLYVCPVLNWFLLWISESRMKKQEGLAQPLTLWGNRFYALGLLVLPVLIIAHLWVWFYPFYNILQYLYQAYGLVVLSAAQIFWVLWTKGWFESQRIWNRMR